MGEGVGSGIVDHDRLLLGNLGIASEIGHISIDVNGPACECGNRGCLELYCSATAMLKKAKKLLPEIFQEEITNRWEACNKVFIAAKEGNEKALELAEFIRDMQPEKQDGYVLLAEIYKDMGDEEKYREQYEIAKEKKPDLKER